MSNIDFQNGLVCGLSLKGLTKASIPLDFLNDHLYYFLEETFNMSSIINDISTLTDDATASTQTPDSNSISDTWNITSTIDTLFSAFSDVTTTEVV